MGRSEAPLDPHNEALWEFAARLRSLRENAGGRSYRQMAKKANFAVPTLARAAAGRRLPSWEVTAAYVAACGSDPGPWRAFWESTARRLDQSTPAVGMSGPRQIPADLPDFVGRDAEYELVAAAPGPATGAAPTIVVVSGPGGIGKTSLAVHAAHRLAHRFPDGLLFADLRAHDAQLLSADAVAARFLADLRGSPDSVADPVTAFRTLTAGRRLLVLLDNAVDETQVSPLLPGSAGCLVIVTSRRALGGLARARTVRLDTLPPAEAVELVCRAAGYEGQPAKVRTLAELCGCFPLALRLASSRLADRPPDTVGWLVGRLGDERQRLRWLASGNLDMGTVFTLSYRALSTDAQRVFRAVGGFPGPDFTTTAIAVMADMTRPEVESALEQLVDASLVQRSDVRQYQIHDLIRLYARSLPDTDNEPGSRMMTAPAGADGTPGVGS